MSKVYFISDVHLGLESKEKEKAKEERLLAFLDQVMEDGQQLFIVGDLFDAWIEYRTVIPKGHHRVLAKLEDLCLRGITIHYLAGNHDFWMRDYFRDELGMKTYADAFDIQVDGKKILLHHGDGLATNDTGYKMLKKVLRNRLSIWLYSWLHPDIGIALARSSSKKSRDYTSTKDYGEGDGMLHFASQKIDEGYDIVIMGHRHEPACREIGRGVYINLGDWISHNTYAEMVNGVIAMKTWKI
ncbi:MAG: UDP-2,3-diacylglucosamine diphosphatase [Ignavibacteria bacterium]|nr:UDP-2,3-diacylglucosamine diphosphatase [Ignavibacteria bacterium]